MSYVYIYSEFEDVDNLPCGEIPIDLKEYPFWNGEFNESIAKCFFQHKRVKICVKHPIEKYYAQTESKRKFREIVLLARTLYSESGEGSNLHQSFSMVRTSRQVITAFSKLHNETSIFYESNVNKDFNLLYQSQINEVLPSFEWFGEWRIIKKEPKTAYEIAHPWALISIRNKRFLRKD